MRRNWLIIAIVAGILVIAAAAIIARLADDDFTTSDDTAIWADSVCSDLGEWQDSITSLADVDDGELTVETFQEKLDEAGAATDELVDDLQGLGPPDLEAGEEAEQALDDAADGLRQSFESLRAAVQSALDADSPTELLQELAALGPELQALVEQVQDTVASLQSASIFGDASAELEQAFADAESCQELQDEG